MSAENFKLLCYVMLCYVMLCYVMLCYVMLCYVMLVTNKKVRVHTAVFTQNVMK